MEAFIRSDMRRAGIIYAFFRGLTRRLKCQTNSGRERLSLPVSSSFPPRNLNSGKTSLVSAIVKPAALPPQGWRDGRKKGGGERGRRREVAGWNSSLDEDARSRRQESGGFREFMLIRLLLNFGWSNLIDSRRWIYELVREVDKIRRKNESEVSLFPRGLF